jgi:hypothetical protein
LRKDIFEQRFFLRKYSFEIKLQSQTVIRKKLRKALSYKKVLVKYW